MKKVIFASVLMSCVLVSSSFATGIPVVDALANAQFQSQTMLQIQQWAKDAQRWIQTVDHYKQQIDAYKHQLATVSGVRDVKGYINSLKSFAKDAQINNMDFDSIISGNSSSSDYQRIMELAEKKLGQYGIFDTCQGVTNPTLKKSCEKQRLSQSVAIVKYDELGKEMQSYKKNFASLANKISRTKDIKESQDVANAINLQVAQLNEKKIEMDMISKQQEVQQKIAEQQANELYNSEITNTGWTNKNYSPSK